MKTPRRFSIKLPHEANDQTKRVLLQFLTLALLAGLIFCGTPNLGALGEPSALSLTFGKTNAHLLALYSMNQSATKITATIGVGSGPEDMLYDPTNGYIYVANTMSNTISVINPVTNSVVGNVTVGAMPMRLLYDPTNGYIYVANSFSGSISVIEASPYKTYTVSFDQSGLPPGTTWSVSLANVMKTSNSNRLEFQVLNGSYQWSVSSPYGYVVNPQSGTLDVRGDNQSVDLIFKPSSSTYALTFSESGLPNGARWSLSVGGNAYATENKNITFSLKPGDYNFSVRPADGYYSVPSFGSIVVSNKPVTLSLLFVPASSPLLPRVTMLPANVSGLKVSVGGSINHSGGFIEKVIWEWGDGKNSTGPFPQSHEYSKPGVYNVTVEVFASNGVMSSSYEIVNVRGTGVSPYIIVGLALASAGVIALTAYKTRFTPKKAEKKNKRSKRKKSNKRRNAVGRLFPRRL